MPSVPLYPYFGGNHAETATVANAIAAYGMVAPHTQKPYTEAMLLGVGGGLGAGYLVFAFKTNMELTFGFGWQNRWNYTMDFYANLSTRLGFSRKIEEGTAKAGQAHLEAMLASGLTAITWVDRATLPYYEMQEWHRGYYGHIVNVYAIENDEVLIDDLAAAPFRVPLPIFRQARNGIPSYKNRIMIINGGANIDLTEGIRAGINDCIEHLSLPSESFSLPVYRKWARLMTDTVNPKGWPVMFKDGIGLYSALVSVYEGIELMGTGGGGLRDLYADFLDEAALVLDRPALTFVSALYRQLAVQWRALAESALPETIEPLYSARKWLNLRYSALMSKGGEASKETTPITHKLDGYAAKYNTDCPLSASEIKMIYQSMSEQLMALYEAEVAAVRSLREAMQD